jgi:hypothetical protein
MLSFSVFSGASNVLSFPLRTTKKAYQRSLVSLIVFHVWLGTRLVLLKWHITVRLVILTVFLESRTGLGVRLRTIKKANHLGIGQLDCILLG